MPSTNLVPREMIQSCGLWWEIKSNGRYNFASCNVCSEIVNIHNNTTLYLEL